MGCCHIETSNIWEDVLFTSVLTIRADMTGWNASVAQPKLQNTREGCHRRRRQIRSLTTTTTTTTGQRDLALCNIIVTIIYQDKQVTVTLSAAWWRAPLSCHKLWESPTPALRSARHRQLKHEYQWGEATWALPEPEPSDANLLKDCEELTEDGDVNITNLFFKVRWQRSNPWTQYLGIKKDKERWLNNGRCCFSMRPSIRLLTPTFIEFWSQIRHNPENYSNVGLTSSSPSTLVPLPWRAHEREKMLKVLHDNLTWDF